MNGYIYCIKNNINNTYYVGQTSQIIKRFRHHKSDLRGNRHHNYLLQEDWNKYGDFITEFISALDAQNHTGVKQKNIQYCCSGRSKTSGGFIWKYSN